MALHFETRIYAAVVELAKVVLPVIRNMHRLAAMPQAQLYAAANSYLGLARQATHSHHDRSRIANLVRRRGLAVDHRLTKALP